MRSSPTVRRHRLGRELREQRERAKLTHAKLGNEIGVSAAKISRLENGQGRPDEIVIRQIADALDVTGDDRAELVELARTAAVHGWWTSQPMDRRQATYADFESGAQTIREYQSTIVPGLLQIEAYTQSVCETDDLTLVGSIPTTSEAVLRARSGRQTMLWDPDGPQSYEVIIHEVVARGFSAPPEILASQLHYLASVGSRRRVTLRVLPVSAKVHGYMVPRGPFSLYTFEDRKDPVVAAVDTLTADVVLMEGNEVGQYESLWERLQKAALSTEDSAALLTEAAAEMERISS
ncbi:Scr1 family TA system antitoxin-like transcriptional regulator [Actinopolymorpha rutila]|uniref:Transcriptional regulator with XRE-family HTH domain n=1 Tax=Actinopolymorpha rutila TaxID=446787 RepID=A0A852ZND3_9ACTN|nr:transcriptional regulator with XRE-family HTH domain [Actinopolymorpha rutila]